MIRPVPQSLLRLFDKGAASYAKFRPEYPPELYQTILQHANLSSCALAADIATGSGQAAKDLSKYFDNVIALDSSKAQLGQAPNLPGVSFQIGHAEDTQLAAESVNLATVAQALHWFDLNRFYPEAKRILKPDGCLAIWGYDVPKFDIANADNLLNDVYTNALGPYWDAKRKHVDNHLAGLEPKQEHFVNVKRIAMDMKKTMNLSQLATAGLLQVGCLTSWSAYNTYLKQQPSGPDPVKQFAADFPTAAQLSSEDSTFDVRFPVFLLMCNNKT